MIRHFILISAAMSLIWLQGCYQNGPLQGIKGEGPVVERKLDIQECHGIVVAGSANVYLIPGEKFEVLAEGQENIIDNLTTDVTGGTWRIGFKRPVYQAGPLKIFITLDEIRLIKISGSGDVSGTGVFADRNDLDLGISGSGDINLKVEAADINARISGSGDIVLAGSADNLEMVVSGSGGIDADDLTAKEAQIRISGSGEISVNLIGRLDARISGSGDIYYSGNPKVHTSTSGSGRVISR